MLKDNMRAFFCVLFASKRVFKKKNLNFKLELLKEDAGER